VQKPKRTVVDIHGRLQLTAEEQHLDEEDPFKFLFTSIAYMQEYVSIICPCPTTGIIFSSSNFLSNVT
jgi:hypothetical protein